MGTYNLPRNVKGEGRILFIFTGKSLMYTVIGGGAGLILFYWWLAMIGAHIPAIVVTAAFALLGFIIGTFKVPDLQKFEFSKKTGGENIDDVIRRAIRFKTKGKKIYVYKEEKTDVR